MDEFDFAFWTKTHFRPSTDSDSWLSGPKAVENQQWSFSSGPQRGLATNEINDTSPIQYQPWNYGSYSSSYNYGSSAKSRKTAYEKLTKAKHSMTQTASRAELAKKVDFMPYGIGRVVMIDDPDPFPGTIQLWHALENERLQWNDRQGIEYASGNDSYWAWLMSAVGQPPVIMFVVLNALIVLVMGPVLYFGLRRRSRLYLLYFMAPTLAFLATSGLFLYAFLSDGFSNRSRIRQLTWIDGRHPTPTTSDGSDAIVPIVDQSRQTYYTVVDSRQGLQFGSEAFVLPVHHSEMMGRYNYNPASEQRSCD